MVSNKLKKSLKLAKKSVFYANLSDVYMTKAKETMAKAQTLLDEFDEEECKNRKKSEDK